MVVDRITVILEEISTHCIYILSELSSTEAVVEASLLASYDSSNTPDDDLSDGASSDLPGNIGLKGATCWQDVRHLLKV